MSARVWDVIMYGGEADMLEMRLDHLAGKVKRTIIVEADMTHRGVPKPLTFLENYRRFKQFEGAITYVPVRGLPSGVNDHWGREHAQRDAAMRVLGDLAGEAVVLIADLDEFPSSEALAWDGDGAVALRQRTCLFAVDWEVPASYPLPPTSVMARMGWLRRNGGSLARARDNRGAYPCIENGGWHFSWIGGPEAHREKMAARTCHVELAGTPEGALIESGERYRNAENGGGIPVVPVEVDESWPQWIRDRKCPASWYRPREAA